MMPDFSSLKLLLGKSVEISRFEFIKRYRQSSFANERVIQFLLMIPFFVIGEDAEGHLYYC
ncbi:MAG: hypothetical protein NVS1B13_25410 [Flavisolibacter sp.]